VFLADRAPGKRGSLSHPTQGALGPLAVHLGAAIAPALARGAATLHARLTKRRPLGDLAPHEEAAVFDLADMDVTIAATKGCDAALYFGGASLEIPSQTIPEASSLGSDRI